MIDYFLEEADIKVTEETDRPDTFIKRTGKDGGAVIGYVEKGDKFIVHYDFKDGDALIDTSESTAGNRFTYSEKEGKWIPDSENVKAESNAKPMVMGRDGRLVTVEKYLTMKDDEKRDFNSPN